MSCPPEWLRSETTGVDLPSSWAPAWASSRSRTRTATSASAWTISTTNHRIPSDADDCSSTRTTDADDDDCCRVLTDRIPTSPNPSPENCAIRRLQLELKDFLMSECDTGISAFPEKDTIMLWKGSITGGKGSVFEGQQYTLSLHFPSDYPFKPPVVRFDRPAPFHPNVGGSCGRCYGKIDLDILLQKWSSAYDVRTVLSSIKTMLEDPNLSAPVNRDAARLWSDQKEYRKMVEKPPQYGPEMRNLDRLEGMYAVGERIPRRHSRSHRF